MQLSLKSMMATRSRPDPQVTVAALVSATQKAMCDPIVSYVWFFLRCDLIVVFGSDLMYLRWFSCFFGVISLCFLWSFDSPTQAFEEDGTMKATAVPMMTLVTEKELHGKSACKVLYIYIYIYACLHILCSFVLLMLLCIHVLMLSWHVLCDEHTQVSALACLKRLALAYLQVCSNGRIPSNKLVDALRFAVKEGLLNIGFVLEA